MTFPDRYGNDVLAAGARTPNHRRRPESRPLPARIGEVVEEVVTGFVGAITRVEKSGGLHIVTLEDRKGRRSSFELGPGFLVDGAPVTLSAPRPAAAAAPASGRTASGSVAVRDAPARVARASRIWVEGLHDAELVEKVWGEDLRVDGVVVEPLGGLDDLAAALKDFGPSRERRVGVLADHLIEGTKETRIVNDAVSRFPAASVLVVGHPYVDVWQAVKPARLGLAEWPSIPRSEDWKTGMLARLGWPHANRRDVAHGWKQILGRVRTIADIEPTLSGRVEELIDFVTVD